ncbi:MAG: phospholipase D-like domain-containing protein [Myxococcota bacterium]
MNASAADRLRVGHELEGRYRAGRLAFVVDGEDYFAAVAEAIERSRGSVVILGWEFHSRIALRRGDQETRLDETLLAAASRGVRVSILLWDHTVLLAGQRELLTGWRLRHDNIEVAYASDHPLGAAHHHTMVVVDGEIAFVGGFDLAAERWDARGHAETSELRRDPDDHPYEPFHDMALIVDDDAARAICDIAAEHWKRATGSDLEVATTPSATAPWPPSFSADLEGVDVGVARTLAPYEKFDGKRSIAAMYEAAIRQAERLIYLENQYLTSPAIAEVLADRLREENGPEVIVVSSLQQEGRLEDMPMAQLRGHWMKQLEDADRHDRLLIGAPCAGDEPVAVHAKLLVVDDALMSLGSANLSQRSMELDTELNLVVEADGDENVAAAISKFRRSLVAEHLGVAPDSLPDAPESWVAAIRERDPERKALASIDRPSDLPEEPALPWRMADSPEPLHVTVPAEAIGVKPRALARLSRRGLGVVAVALLLALLFAIDATTAALRTLLPIHFVYLAAAIALFVLLARRLRRRVHRYQLQREARQMSNPRPSSLARASNPS